MNQSVITFASVAARNAAIPAPLEGQLVWLEDTNKYVYYTGSAWVDLIAPAGSGNALINGAFDIWQRGTSIANTGANAYGADRWALGAGALSATTISRQAASTVGARYGMRWGRNSGVTTATLHRMTQAVETANSLQFAGRTVTFSFNALRGANAPTSLTAVIYYGTGTDQAANDIWSGWTGGTRAVATAQTIGTTVGSFSVSAAIPSTATQIAVMFEYDSVGTAGAAEWFQVENVQLEASSTATPFRRNANSIQGELAACQRYYYRVNSGAAFTTLIAGAITTSTTACGAFIQPAVPMRAVNSFEFSTIFIAQRVTTSTDQVVTSATLGEANQNITEVVLNVASGLTVRNFATVKSNNSATAFIALNGEL
jgi:hypothetical protein